jgi:hypothetical protein
MGKKQKDISLLQEALTNFDQALLKSEQLPKFITQPLAREKRQTEEKIEEIKAEAQSKPLTN